MKQLIMFNDTKPEAFRIYSEQILNHPSCSNVVDKLAGCLYLPSVVDYFASCAESTYRSVAESIKKKLDKESFAGNRGEFSCI